MHILCDGSVLLLGNRNAYIYGTKVERERGIFIASIVCNNYKLETTWIYHKWIYNLRCLDFCICKIWGLTFRYKSSQIIWQDPVKRSLLTVSQNWRKLMYNFRIMVQKVLFNSLIWNLWIIGVFGSNNANHENMDRKSWASYNFLRPSDSSTKT